MNSTCSNFQLSQPHPELSTYKIQDVHHKDGLSELLFVKIGHALAHKSFGSLLLDVGVPLLLLFKLTFMVNILSIMCYLL